MCMYYGVRGKEQAEVAQNNEFKLLQIHYQ